MHLKVTPNVAPRYWAAIMIASVCGTNLGDIIPDVLKLTPAEGLIVLALMFAILVLVERATANGSEVFYWIAILLVRAAATNIADYSIDHAHLTYFDVVTALAISFIGIVMLRRRSTLEQTKGALQTDGLYWLTMLIAGTLGTATADAIGHSFNSVKIGVPISASIATLALLLILIARTRLMKFGATSYWVTVAAIRWWGTNVGDISAFFLSLVPSAAIAGFALSTLLSASAIISSAATRSGR
jgi:uncharacterized membrane-anchored protein